MTDVINLISEHWEVIAAGLGILGSLIFGKKYKQAKDLIKTIKVAWEDNYISDKERKQITKKLNKFLGRK